MAGFSGAGEAEIGMLNETVEELNREKARLTEELQKLPEQNLSDIGILPTNTGSTCLNTVVIKHEQFR